MRETPRIHPTPNGLLRSRVVLLGLACIALLCVAAAPASGQSIAVLHALLQSGQETPPNGSQSFGNAFMTVDLSTSMLCYSITYTDLESPELFAHFHGPAQPGETAGVLYTITPDGSPKTGCVGPLTGQEKGWLSKGLFYINIHSEDHTPGEIRGQVMVQGLVPAP